MPYIIIYMKSHIQKDHSKRQLFKHYELKRRLYKLLLLKSYQNKFLFEKINKIECTKSNGHEYEYNNQYIKCIQKLPRNSSITRVRNRCAITGRPRGVIKSYKISRIVFRSYANNGMLPGIIKASW